MDRKELMILKHDPVPGYRSFFYVAVGVGVLYLVLAFGGII